MEQGVGRESVWCSVVRTRCERRGPVPVMDRRSRWLGVRMSLIMWVRALGRRTHRGVFDSVFLRRLSSQRLVRGIQTLWVLIQAQRRVSHAPSVSARGIEPPITALTDPRLFRRLVSGDWYATFRCYCRTCDRLTDMADWGPVVPSTEGLAKDTIGLLRRVKETCVARCPRCL